ncbi:MAG: Rieske 2Fe-2S domain-containing protein [Gammaproteobacteria bacterium]|nr:Rieske 2Fe-2S domain-containing protein [Gammaproteobacteria bacterium]
MNAAWLDLGSTGEFAADRHAVVLAGDKRLVVVNLAGEFTVFPDFCTHDYTSFESGKLQDGSLVCPRHGGRFCARTGQARKAPPRHPLPAFEVRLADGRLFARPATS